MVQYKFKARELKTGKWVEGDLAYATRHCEKKQESRPMILNHKVHGGMVWITEKHFIDETTIQPINCGIWKDAQGDKLPDINKKVVAITESNKVVFAYRPSSSYGSQYESILDDKGGWNQEGIVWWLDVDLPFKEE